ncbi:hypothetical protein QCA50_016013 [Cerrena zonata]|uniref:Uncharacterized protein n=1 Tax=Cerrena zonata TaxID=2478898 RepID=A0AAW0FPU1_9APHY
MRIYRSGYARNGFPKRLRAGRRGPLDPPPCPCWTQATEPSSQIGPAGPSWGAVHCSATDKPLPHWGNLEKR